MGQLRCKSKWHVKLWISSGHKLQLIVWPMGATDSSQHVTVWPMGATDSSQHVTVWPIRATHSRRHATVWPLGATESRLHLRVWPLGATESRPHLRVWPLGATESRPHLRVWSLGAIDSRQHVYQAPRIIWPMGQNWRAQGRGIWTKGWRPRGRSCSIWGRRGLYWTWTIRLKCYAWERGCQLFAGSWVFRGTHQRVNWPQLGASLSSKRLIQRHL